MPFRIRAALTFLLFISAGGAVRAQSPIYLGGGISGAFNWHTLNVPVYRNDTLCGVFKSGTSILPNGFLLFEKPLGDPAHSLWIAPRLHLADLGATISTPSSNPVDARSPVDSSLVPVTQVSHLQSTLVALGADLFVKYPLASTFFLFGGPSISYLIQRNWNVSEIIQSPSFAHFEDGTQTRTITNGQIPNSAAIFASATLGTSLDVPLSPKVVLAPELSVTAPLTSIRSDYSWHVWSFALGCAIKFNIAPTPGLQAVIKQSPPPPASAFAATVHISGVITDSNGAQMEVPNPQIRVEEFQKSDAYPTLNYIFFDEDSSHIPSRYHLFSSGDSASAFDPNTLAGAGTLGIYHNELNIIGKRMTETPSITVTLTGANAGDSIEAKDKALARNRAESVRDYLVSAWNIDPNRITVRTEGLPANPSPQGTEAGNEENRRVEITSNDPSLLDPLTISTVERTMNPPIIRLRTTYSSNITLAESTLALKQGNQVLTSYRGPGAMMQWNPTPDELPRTDSLLIASMHLTDSVGATYEASDTAHVELLTIRKKREERVKDKIIEDYNLITFNFDKSDLNDRSERVIAEIAKSVTPGTHIKITGYTDVTGESQHDLQLSEARATAVADALKSTLGSTALAVTFQTNGEGKDNLVDNRLPEGRFLSRTVFVELQKPVQ